MNTAYNMDCIDGMKQLPSDIVDLTVTSPPYDNIRDYNGFSFEWKRTLEELFRITKPGGVVVWIVADQTINGSETGASFRQALYAMECGFNLHDTMIWDKGATSFPDSNRYLPCFEYMFVFSKGKPKTTNLIADRRNLSEGIIGHGTWRQKDGSLKPKTGKRMAYGEYGRRFNVWNIPPCVSNNERTGHPAQFPIRLASDHIRSWSNEGDTVLDPFLGSGTTRIAAYDLQRNFIGYEISKEYYDQQEERFSLHSSQTSMFDKEGNHV